MTREVSKERGKVAYCTYVSTTVCAYGGILLAAAAALSLSVIVYAVFHCVLSKG